MAVEFTPWHDESDAFRRCRLAWNLFEVLMPVILALVLYAVIVTAPEQMSDMAYVVCLILGVVFMRYSKPLIDKLRFRSLLNPVENESRSEMRIFYTDSNSSDAMLLCESGAASFDEDEIVFRSSRCSARIRRRDFSHESWSLGGGNYLSLPLAENPRVVYQFSIFMPEEEASERIKPFRISHKAGGQLPDPVGGIREASEVWVALGAYAFFAVPLLAIVAVFALKSAADGVAAIVAVLVGGFAVALYVGTRLRRNRLAWLESALAEIAAWRAKPVVH